MAIAAKVTYIFNLSRWGWSETYYWQSGLSGLDNAKSAAIALLVQRMTCLSQSVVCDGIRISDLSAPFSSISTVQTNVNIGPTNLGDQEPWAALLTRINAVGAASGINYRREFLMRGLPFAWNKWNATAPTLPNLTPVGLAAVNAFLAYLVATTTNPSGNWSVRGVNRSPTDNPPVGLGAVTLVQPGSFFQFAGSPGTTYDVGDRVLIGKAKGYGIKGLIGPTYITASVPGGPYTTSSRQCGPVQGIVITKPGTVRKSPYIIVPITEAAVERWVKRDTGRPFAVTVGRHKGRCS
jgi:hypothetical protein